MPDPMTNWFFAPRRDGAGVRHDDDHDDDSAPGLTGVPAAVLQRHGARVLDPGNAAAVPDFREQGPNGNRTRTPRATVYRARTLMIPADLLRNSEVTQAINGALALVGMNIVRPELDNRPVRNGGPVAQVLQRLPRPAVLVPAPPEPGMPAKPVVVNAWVALQALRAAADAAEQNGDAADQDAVLSKRVVSRIGLEHLLVGSAITGSPATEGNGVSGSPATEGNGVTGPGSTDSYVYSGGDTRIPVAICLDPPARRALGDCGPRRPVVAVLDTGVRAHPWLDVRRDSSNEYQTEADGFVAVDLDLQEAIYLGSQSIAQEGDQPRQLIRDPWDTPITADPLIGELDTDTGHGTFIAGIVRQAAPDAQVLAVRIMHSDGVVYEGDLICALSLLADRIAVAEAGDMAGMVDVVSLSLGYFDESSADVRYSSGLWQVIEVLLGLGVAVVAAAGNYSTSRRFYPAAFTLLPPPGPVPMISVGALNPNGSKALFSDDGRWVTAWAAGASVVSTYPDDINGRRCPQIRMRAYRGNGMPSEVTPASEREALDPDDYRGGFAVWSGTSFSAPLLAAHIARHLLEDAADPGLGLGEPGAQAATNRTVAALRKMRWPG
jgi:subtilisin family serine protease